jgi:hypothetical protein
MNWQADFFETSRCKNKRINCFKSLKPAVNMKRRNFIALTTLSAAAVSVPFLSCAGSTTEWEKKLATPQTLSRLTDENTIIAIGKTYGSLHTEEYTKEALADRLQKDNQGNIAVKDVEALLEKNIYEDLDQGNTIVLNGWVLSKTEARQCALFSLTHH